MEFTVDDRRNRWLRIVSGDDRVAAPIRITQQATFAVARLEGESAHYAFAPKRYGFLFVADGTVAANGERLQTGDAVRLYDVGHLTIAGDGELVLWDLPGVVAA
jgi:redox-sensitive bicupin YhaK (pirin superfamily)